MDRSGHVLVVWWALFVVVHCVLAMLCCIGSLARATMLMAPSALHYVPWCMLWSSLLTLATCASCGTPPSAPPQRREGHSVMMALCAWLPWRCFHGARQAAATSSRHDDVTPLHVASVPARAARDAPLSAPPRRRADESVQAALSGWRPLRCLHGTRRAATTSRHHGDTTPLHVAPAPVRVARDAPLRAPPRHHAGKSVAAALSGWRLLAVVWVSVLVMPMFVTSVPLADAPPPLTRSPLHC